MSRIIIVYALAIVIRGIPAFGAVLLLPGSNPPAPNSSDVARWDAKYRVVPGLGERSLFGGLRYSVQGDSFAAYRDMFTWSGPTPSEGAFQQAIEDAFNAWTVVDPATGLGTALSFVADLGKPVSAWNDPSGAEIDLLADPDLNGYGAFAIFATTDPTTDPTTLTLTSGTQDYPGRAIVGADIKINSSGVAYSLDNGPLSFRMLLTHEIGHTLGLNDVDLVGSIDNFFIDDNFNQNMPLETLTNSWALSVNPFDPGSSFPPLDLFQVANPFGGGNPDLPGLNGFDTPGVSILMESNNLGGQTGGQVGPTALRADDFGGRQFLYPAVVPEPSSLPIWALICSLAGACRWCCRRA